MSTQSDAAMAAIVALAAAADALIALQAATQAALEAALAGGGTPVDLQPLIDAADAETAKVQAVLTAAAPPAPAAKKAA